MTTLARARPMHARRLLVALAFTSLVVPAALAQSQVSSAPEALLDRMTGHWVMTGTIAKKMTTHDVDVDWVLKREYLRIHEVSRDKDANGDIGYEAWIYIVWDAKNSEYAVMWLDNTAATNFAAEGIGHAKPDGDRIASSWILRIFHSSSRMPREAVFRPSSHTIARRIRGRGRSTTWTSPGKRRRSRG